MDTRRVILMIALLLGVIVFAPIAVWIYYDIKFGRQLNAELEALKAVGMPVTLAEAAPPPVPDDQNAAVLYQKVFDVEFVREQRYEGEKGMAGLSREELDLLIPYCKDPNAQLENEVRQLLARPEVRKALEILRRGSNKPHCVFPANWHNVWRALFSLGPPFRDATDIVATRALLSANEGHIDEAIDWCEVALRMSEHAASEPRLMAQLVSYAMQGLIFVRVKQFLPSAELPPSVANRLEKSLHQLDFNKTFTEAMIGERAVMDQTLNTMYHLPDAFSVYLSLAGDDATVSTPLYFSWLGRPLHKLDRLIFLEYMDKHLQFAHLPYREAKAKTEAERANLNELSAFQGVLTKAFGPMLWDRSFQKRDRVVANIELCRVVLALKAYKYTHGAYPITLAQLQETLDWQLPEDPFSGQDFVYRRTDEGFKLYSFGSDLDDDSGTRSSFDDRDIVWECTR